MNCYKYAVSALFGHRSSISHGYHLSKDFIRQIVPRRAYSQRHDVKEKKDSGVIITPTRPRRKKTLIESKIVENSGFWKVFTIATAEEYNLESMYQFIQHHASYKLSDTFNKEVSSSESNYDFLHIVAKSPVDHEKREIFVFCQGAIVIWNISDAEISNILDMVRNFEVNKYDNNIIQNEAETMPYTYSINSKQSVLQNGNIYLTQEEGKSSYHKYTYSNGMALSVKLGIWEGLLDKYIESVELFTLDLKQGNPITIGRKELLKKIGELYALKHSINLSSDLLDIPDFYWEREELENLYLKTCKYFNIPKRTQVINVKLNHCIELVDLLSTHLSDKHHVRLEWMIIALIMVEVMFEIIHYVRMYV